MFRVMRKHFLVDDKQSPQDIFKDDTEELRNTNQRKSELFLDTGGEWVAVVERSGNG